MLEKLKEGVDLSLIILILGALSLDIFAVLLIGAVALLLFAQDILNVGPDWRLRAFSSGWLS
jgi:hypothetical protein